MAGPVDSAGATWPAVGYDLAMGPSETTHPPPPSATELDDRDPGVLEVAADRCLAADPTTDPGHRGGPEITRPEALPALEPGPTRDPIPSGEIETPEEAWDSSPYSAPRTDAVESEWSLEAAREAAAPAIESPVASLPFTDWSLPDPDEAVAVRALGYDPRMYLRDTFCPRSHQTVLGMGELEPPPGYAGHEPIRSTSPTAMGLGAPSASQVEALGPRLHENRRSSASPRLRYAARGTAAVLVLGAAAAAVFGVVTRQSSTPRVAAASDAVSTAELAALPPSRAIGVGRPNAGPWQPSRSVTVPPANSVARIGSGFESDARTIEIRATPPGAWVYEHGKRIGKTPVEIRLAPGKDLNLLVAADGHRPKNVTLDGSEPKVSVALVPYPPTNGQSAIPPVDAGIGMPADTEVSRTRQPVKPWEPEVFTLPE
jgi:hypothetical protein